MAPTQPVEDGQYPVKLYVYDLSRGMARQMSLPLTGRQIDGIWHTSIVAWDREYFFGQGISIVYPGTSHHGAPFETFDLGTTSIDRETFEGALLPDLRERFRPQGYHLISWNCNNFTQEVTQILTGGDIPTHIRSLPQDFLSTPFGQMLQPQIDAMFRQPSVDLTAPFAATTGPLGNNLLNQVASRAYTGNTPVEASPSSKPSSSYPVRHITSQAQLSEILSLFPCVAVLYTSESCPPCRIIKPAFQDLAHHHHVDESLSGSHKRGAFVQVESNASTSSLFAQSQVTATPTVKLYTFGKETNQVKGADVGELKTAVELMLFEAYPPHPHARLSKPLKSLNSLPSQSHLYSAMPNLSSLLQKIDTAISQHSAKSFAEKADLQEARKIIANNWIPWLESTRDQKASKPLTSALSDGTSSTAKLLASSLAIEGLFPVLDLFRLSVLHESFVRAVFRDPTAADRKEINGVTRLLSHVSDLAYKGEWSTSQRPLLLTAARLLTNLAASTPFVEVIESHENVRSLVLELTTSLLLCPDAGVRSAAATCAFNLALHQHAERPDWMAATIKVLPEGAGWAVVCGLGFFFAAFMIVLSFIQQRYTNRSIKDTDEFASASRSVKPGLVAAGICSAWTWSSTLLQSTAVTTRLGISGGYCARGLLFSGNPLMPALSADDITAGLSAPAAGVALAGTGGAVAILIILFLAVTSASSAQQVAVASVLTFDVYKPYIRPNASKREIFIMSHAGVLIWAIVMALFDTIFHYAGISLGWLYLAQGIIIAPAVVPIFCGLVWKRTNKLACIVAMVVGIVCGVVAWLVTASCLYGEVSVATTGKDYPTLAGNVVSLGVSAIITLVGSLLRPETEDHFALTRSINAPADVVERMVAHSGRASPGSPASPSTPDAEKSHLDSEKVAYTLETVDYVKAAGLDAGELRKTLRLTSWINVAASITLCVLIPACLASRKVWNSTGLSAYIWIGFIWLVWTTLAVGVLPIWESRHELAAILSGIGKDLVGNNGKVEKETVTTSL
ncbi:hypothetical protein NDA16_005107 [Ustilago loliicola]|nr:hypothetical protein NDA16_005107 [Ustilago loliicola]